MSTWRQTVGVAVISSLLVDLCLAGEPAGSGLALAYPVEGLQIDGDLSDWPAELPRYPIAVPSLGLPRNPQDCSAEFRVGYHEKENALYLGVEVQDADEPEPEDGSVVLFTNDLVVVVVAIPGEGGDPLILGFLRDKEPAPKGVAQTITVYGAGSANYEPQVGFQAEVRDGRDHRGYEFRIDFTVISQRRFQLRPDATLELSLWVHDLDEVAGEVDAWQSTWTAWVNGNALSPGSGRGELLLVPSGVKAGRLSGLVKPANGHVARSHKRIRLEAQDVPGLVVHALTDGLGRFAVDLPVGRYGLDLDERGHETRPDAEVEVQVRKEATVELQAQPVVGLECAAEPARVQPAGRGSRQGRWRAHGLADGLPAITVRAIVQDQRGDLWLGMEGGGLVRFDGARFIRYDTEELVRSSTIRRTVEDGKGNLWFLGGNSARGKGVACLDPERRRFQCYDQADGLIPGTVNDLALDQGGRICLSSQGGVSRFDPERGQFVQFTVQDGLPTALIRRLATSDKGHLWVGAWFSQQIVAWEGETFRPHAVPVPVRSFDVLLEDRTGGLWVAARGYAENGGVPFLWRYDGQHWERFTEQHGYGLGTIVETIYEDRAGQIWLGTNAGLLRFRADRFEDVGATTGLGQRTVSAVLEDREGRLWVGLEGGGLKVLDPAWVTYSTDDGLPHNNVTSLAGWEGRLLVGTQGGLSWKTGSGFEPVLGLTNQWIHSVLPDGQGRFWVAHDNGVSLLGQDGQFIGEDPTTPTIPDVDVRQCMAMASSGALWLLPHGRGLCRRDPSGGLTMFTTQDGLADNLTSCLGLDDADTLWVGTQGRGVSRFVRTNFHTYTRIDGLAGDEVTAISRGPRRTLWVGTTTGLSRYDGQRWQTFTRADGLPADHITVLLLDRSGHRLWIGTAGGGLAVYDADLNVIQASSWQDGLGRDTVNALAEDPDGSLWLGTEDGLTHYRAHRTPPSVRVTGVITDERLDPSRPISLVGRPRRLLFQFEGSSFRTHPEHMAYLCQLVGYDPDQRAVYEGQVTYTNVPQGEYEFQVWAVDQDLNVSSVAVVPVVTRFDYAQMALVGGLGLSLAAGLTLGGIALKHRRERNQALLQRNRSLQEAKEAAESANRAKSAFLAKDLDPTGPGANGSLWVHGDAGKLRQVLINLLGNAVKFTERGSVTLRVQVKAGGPKSEVDDRRSEIGYGNSQAGGRGTSEIEPTVGCGVARPAAAVENAGGWLRFEVADTGPGVPAETLARLFQPFEQGELGQQLGGAGLGLAIARGLVALLGGQLEVSSRPGFGSRFWFELPWPMVSPHREIPALETSGRIAHLEPGSRIRALVVDDVAENREILGSMLRLIGCECRLAASGAEAIELFQAERPDITFLDIRMPGLDGVETLKRLQESAAVPPAPAADTTPEGAGLSPRCVAISASVLEREGYRIQAVPTGELALQVIERGRPDVVLLDVMLPGIDGFETCRRLRANPATRNIPVIFLTAREDTAGVVEGFRAGGVDYITKPFRTEEVVSRVKTHETLHRQTEELRRRTEQLQAEIARREQAEASFHQVSEQLTLISEREAERWGLGGLVGESPTLRRVLADIHKLHRIAARTTVLITGESGTGKELVARAVHYGGPRARGPFVVANCSALPSELVESILLGHLKGAFTGANADRKGYFEQAHGGSLFLDEIADMPLALQAKLLRVLETGIVTPVGSAEERPSDVQVIAATNAELPLLIERGRFRQDLYFRLARFTIEVPPLRERRNDIVLLVDHFLRLLSSEMGLPRPELSPTALATLQAYDYPGNVRELKNLLERALIETGGGRIDVEHLDFLPGTGLLPANDRMVDPPLDLALRSAEERILDYLHAHATINNTECRDLLGVGLQRASYLLRKLHASGQLERDSSRRWAHYRLQGHRE